MGMVGAGMAEMGVAGVGVALVLALADSAAASPMRINSE